ncbi:MAG: DUF5640 domain-containing protein [Stenotrophomonas sp.]|uniref:DUF5640 domain-containing protein n=1 Tax=Stenotrophomonas sp. TaxID=69392 RepID=UPI0028A6D5BD|nr:DUF5640 domain-containing protein [Stenotrophomonas sp.]
MKKWLVLVLVMLLAGCSQGLSGTWSDAMGMVSYTFQRDGNVTVEMLGKAQQTTYTREEDSLKVKVPGTQSEAVEFKVNADGSLQGPMGVRLQKQEK